MDGPVRDFVIFAFVALLADRRRRSPTLFGEETREGFAPTAPIVWARSRPPVVRVSSAGGSATLMSTTSAPVAATRSTGARCTLTPRAPPPIATTSRPSIDASAITGHRRSAPNGVIAPRS